MWPFRLREVIRDLVLGANRALRKGVESGARGVTDTPSSKVGHQAVVENQSSREGLQSCGEIVGSKESRVPATSDDDLVDSAAPEQVGFIELPFVRGLNAIRVEHWVDRIGARGLHPVIGLEAPKQLILIADVVVNTSAQQPLSVQVVLVTGKFHGAGGTGTKSRCAREIAASKRAVIGRS